VHPFESIDTSAHVKRFWARTQSD